MANSSHRQPRGFVFRLALFLCTALQRLLHHLLMDQMDGVPMDARDLLHGFDCQPPAQQLPHPSCRTPRYPCAWVFEGDFLCKARPAFRTAIAVHNEAQLLLAANPYRHVPQIHAPAVIDVYCTAAHRASHICCSLPTLKQQHCLGSFNVCCVCFAFVPLTFDLDCYILFSEHGLTSFLCV